LITDRAIDKCCRHVYVITGSKRALWYAVDAETGKILKVLTTESLHTTSESNKSSLVIGLTGCYA
jgi:hypothetical protein